MHLLACVAFIMITYLTNFILSQCAGIDGLHELVTDLLEVMTNWFTVGVFLGMSYYTLEAIQKDYRDQSKDCLRVMLAAWLRGGNASTALLVQALSKAGFVVLAKKMAVKHGE